MKQIKFDGQDGPQLVSTLAVNEELAAKYIIPEPEMVLSAFKNVLIQALDKRKSVCFSKVTENTERLIETNEHSIAYVSIDEAVNVYSQPSYDAMTKTIQLIKENKYDEITAHGWCQIQKSLYWVKPVNKDMTDSEGHKQTITFAHLISVVLENVIDTSVALVNKKD
nr:MAG TPA: hypothetical protein [Crassvirales sp.]